MDREIEFLVDHRPGLLSRLRRNLQTGCLEWIGPKVGRSAGNPLLGIRKGKKQNTILLRRWIWQLHHGRLAPNKYVFMTCLQFNCVEPLHMSVVSKHRPYRNNSFLVHSIKYSPENIRLVRYFRKVIPPKTLACWIHTNPKVIRSIWKILLFPEIPLPAGYAPPAFWIKRAERFSHCSPSGHYLGPKNRATALRDINESKLTPITKTRLLQYAEGEDFTAIAKRSSRDMSSVRESIRNGLRRLYRELGPKEWLILLIKDPHGS